MIRFSHEANSWQWDRWAVGNWTKLDPSTARYLVLDGEEIVITEGDKVVEVVVPPFMYDINANGKIVRVDTPTKSLV